MGDCGAATATAAGFDLAAVGQDGRGSAYRRFGLWRERRKKKGKKRKEKKQEREKIK